MTSTMFTGISLHLQQNICLPIFILHHIFKALRIQFYIKYGFSIVHKREGVITGWWFLHFKDLAEHTWRRSNVYWENAEVQYITLAQNISDLLLLNDEALYCYVNAGRLPLPMQRILRLFSTSTLWNLCLVPVKRGCSKYSAFTTRISLQYHTLLKIFRTHMYYRMGRLRGFSTLLLLLIAVWYI